MLRRSKLLIEKLFRKDKRAVGTLLFCTKSITKIKIPQSPKSVRKQIISLYQSS